uniref:Uncharacterized protein n=1 Tax=Anopheles coluzzii TaxID=1518534 RepID=A0A8W7PB56_ANOCL
MIFRASSSSFIFVPSSRFAMLCRCLNALILTRVTGSSFRNLTLQDGSGSQCTTTGRQPLGSGQWRTLTPTASNTTLNARKQFLLIARSGDQGPCDSPDRCWETESASASASHATPFSIDRNSTERATKYSCTSPLGKERSRLDIYPSFS